MGIKLTVGDKVHYVAYPRDLPKSDMVCHDATVFALFMYDDGTLWATLDIKNPAGNHRHACQEESDFTVAGRWHRIENCK